MKKKCFKCERELDVSMFYSHPKTKDGLLNKCKDCTKKDSSDTYKKNNTNEEWAEKEKTRSRIRGRTTKRKTSQKVRIDWENRFPEKVKASQHCQHLKKPFDGAEKHHWSYNEPHYKDVIWLTRQEHGKIHRFIVYDQERMMYRRIDTNELLATKELHESFIKHCIKNKPD